MVRGTRDRSPRAPGFTLVELLVVIGIITILLSILLPSLIAVRAAGQATQCASNVRQIATALINYAQENNGLFPPNRNAPSPGRYWTDPHVIGRYLPQAAVSGSYGVGGTVFVCPSDPGAQRSYAMNVFASSDSDFAPVPQYGVLWGRRYEGSSTLMLVLERWSNKGSEAAGWYSEATIGSLGTAGPNGPVNGTPGRRLGAGCGFTPPIFLGRFGQIYTELPYYRHRRGIGIKMQTPTGRVNIGYADGHADARTEGELGDAQTAKSTLNSRWSPIDADINN